MATFSTFLLSAVLHEVLFSMAFKTIQPWFFLGMLAQVSECCVCCLFGVDLVCAPLLDCLCCSQMPMAYISKAFKGRRRGNLLMWFGLFTGQPLLEVTASVCCRRAVHSLLSLSLTPSLDFLHLAS